MRLAAVALAFFLSVPAVAAALEKYRGWEQSPQGLFMTADERRAWSALSTDAEAEAFVREFLAKRGGAKFEAEVAKRAEMADRYLTIGKVKGSQSLRGKAVILFGAPANIQVADRQTRKGYVPPPSSAGVSDISGGASTRSADGDTQSLATSRAGTAFRDFTFTFAAATTPAFGGKDYVVTIETDQFTGKDRLRDQKLQADLDAKFETVAAASIQK